MNNANKTKRALLASALSLVLCVSMLIGSTYAWFTDSVTSGSNIIKAGNLEVALVDADGKSLEGEMIEWAAADGRAQNEILWEPGCTYNMEPVYVVNKGSLALKYQIVITGIDGNAKLLEAIEWTITIDGEEITDLSEFVGELYPEAGKDTSGAIVLSGHMKKDAGNEYQGLTADGISIAVYATQLTAEEDSFDDQYDEKAEYAAQTLLKNVAAVAAGESATVKLESDGYVVVNNENPIGAKVAGDVTVDLNGKTLFVKAEDGNAQMSLFNIIKDGKLTVTGNGTIKMVTGANPLVTAIFNNTAGTLVIENGTYKMDHPNTSSVSLIPTIIDNNGNVAAVTTTINDGNFYHTRCMFRNFPSNNGITRLTINGGTFNGKADGWATIWNQKASGSTNEGQSLIEINGGTFNYVEINNEFNTGVTVKDGVTTYAPLKVGKNTYHVSTGMADSWYEYPTVPGKIEADIYLPEDLYAFSMMYKNGDLTETGSHSDLTLKADLDFAGKEWEPIGRFCTNIHGGNHTISNLSNSLLGCVYDCQIYDLTLKNVTAKGSAAGVIAKEMAGDMYLNNVVIAGQNTVTFVEDGEKNWPEEGRGVGALCGVSLIGCGGHGDVNVTIDGTIAVNYGENTLFDNNTNLENLGVSKECGLNMYKPNAFVTVTGAENITTTGSWSVKVSTAKGLQNFLDSAKDGMTIYLTEGVDYGFIELGRPTKNNDTVMTCETHSYSTTNAAEFKEHLADGQWHSTPQYTTTLKNLTVVGAKDATVAGLLTTSGHMYGDVYDYVRDKDYDVGSAYYNTLNLSNVVFSKVNFTAKIDINTADATSVYDGVTFDECTFTTGGTDSSNGAAIRYYNEVNNGNVKNIVVKNCAFNNCYQGVYVQNVNGVTVTGSTFDTTGHNAIGIQGSNVNLKKVVIIGNTFNKIGDRVIRFDTVASDSNITIQNNKATNSGNTAGEIMKATSIEAGVVTNISDNTWCGTVVNTELQDK